MELSTIAVKRRGDRDGFAQCPREWVDVAEDPVDHHSARAVPDQRMVRERIGIALGLYAGLETRQEVIDEERADVVHTSAPVPRDNEPVDLLERAPCGKSKVRRDAEQIGDTVGNDDPLALVAKAARRSPVHLQIACLPAEERQHVAPHFLVLEDLGSWTGGFPRLGGARQLRRHPPRKQEQGLACGIQPQKGCHGGDGIVPIDELVDGLIEDAQLLLHPYAVVAHGLRPLTACAWSPRRDAAREWASCRTER